MMKSGSLSFFVVCLAGSLQTCAFLEYKRLEIDSFDGVRVRPYLFGQQRLPECTFCNNVTTYYGYGFCRYEESAEKSQNFKLCGVQRQTQLLEYLKRLGWNDILTFTPSDFWPYIEGTTLLFVGDSITADHFVAFECFFSEYRVEPNALPIHNNQTIVKALWKFTWPFCYHMLYNTRLCFIRSNTVEYFLDVVLPLLPSISRTKDVLVLNFALWYKGGYEAALTQLLTRYLAKTNLPKLVWRTTQPSHFGESEDGLYPGHGANPNRNFTCAPIPHVTFNYANVTPQSFPLYVTSNATKRQIVASKGGTYNMVSTPIIAKANVAICDIYNLTVPLWEFHRLYEAKDGKGYKECLHSCHPSAPQLWVYAMYQTLMKQ